MSRAQSGKNLLQHEVFSNSSFFVGGVVDNRIRYDRFYFPMRARSIIFASRGCVNNCLNCVVPKLEGKICHEHESIKKFIWKEHTKLIFFDNNILAMQYWKEIFNEIIMIGMEVDFNQGLEARLISEEAASLISKMNIPRVRLAYDGDYQKEFVKNAINILGKHGIKKRQILIYTMFNFTETPQNFLDRVRDIFEWGAACYPMRFQPVNTLKKDSYISPNWTQEELNMVASARRVIGYGGAFPPYEGLKKKFDRANNFQEAFELFPINNEIIEVKKNNKIEDYSNN
jgi:hypothetical protein